jgi:cytoskeleton protein RodZ
MGAFGERLRREREMRGITLDEISESTKISRRHLESLEKEDFEALPGGIFNKGFVRAYARFLGLDEDQAVADYSAVSGEPAAPPDQFPLDVHNKPDPKMNPRRSTLPLVLAVVALLAVLAVLWARNRARRAEGPANAAPPAAVASSSSLPTSSLPLDPPATPSTPSPAPVAATRTPVVSPTAEHMFTVVVKAKEDAWVRLTADGKETWAGMMKADTQRLVRAAKRIVLYTGNAGGIEVRHNGRPLGPLGSESEIRTLTFNPSGLVQ